MRPDLSMCVVLVALSAIFTVPTMVYAHGGAKGIVKERMEVMKAIGKAMKIVGTMTRGKVPLDPAKIQKAAAEIADHGLRIPAMFPKGGSHGGTEASPEIWLDPEGFQKSADGLVAAARTLAAAARTNDASAVNTAYRALGKTCGSCHKQFRIKKNKRKH